MKKSILFLCIGILFSISLNAFATSQRVVKIIESVRKPSEHSVILVRLSDGKVIFEYNPDKLISPASVTKLLTAAAALEKLTPAFTFKTNFYYTGTLINGVISGDLIVVGDGDPFLVSEKLWPFAAELKERGIKEISGGIIIDNSLFDAQALDAMRKYSKNYSEHAYDSPVSALGVNFNTVTVTVAHNYKVGDRALVSIDPYSIDSVVLRNQATTSKAGIRNNIKVSRRSDPSGLTIIDVTGTIALDSDLDKYYRSVNNHVRVSGETIKSFLVHENIVVKGAVREASVKTDSVSKKYLATLESYDLGHVIKGLNKYSNNYIADMLVKKLASNATPKSAGTLDNGIRVMQDFLEQQVKIKSKFLLRNGSGLNKDNRLSARQVVQVLEYMYKRLDLFPEFLASLPAAGWDGTLSDRFKSDGFGGDLDGKIRAKTGTLSNPISVSSLAGYFYHRTHGLSAFAILESGVGGKTQPSILDLRHNQEKILRLFYDSF